MKRGTLLLAAAAAAVAVLAMFPAGAVPTATQEVSPHPGCMPATLGTVFGTPEVNVGDSTIVARNYHGFLYCGYHWPTLPVRFRVDTAGAPANVTTGQFENATKAAAATWNQWWPLNPSASAGCSARTLMCYESATSQVVVKFGALPTGVVGQAAVSATSDKAITSVTVTLNSALTWKVAAGMDQVRGETVGVVGSACVAMCPGPWYDLQNVLAHELGHAIGFEDLGNQSNCGADALEAIDYGQTMYGCLHPGDTSKRTLGWGDQLGLARLAEEYLVG